MKSTWSVYKTKSKCYILRTIPNIEPLGTSIPLHCGYFYTSTARGSEIQISERAQLQNELSSVVKSFT